VIGSQRWIRLEPRQRRPTGVGPAAPTSHLPLSDTTSSVLRLPRLSDRSSPDTYGGMAEMARILHRVRPCCTFRAIAVQYGLVRGTSGTLIIPGSWVRAPPAPPRRRDGRAAGGNSCGQRRRDGQGPTKRCCIITLSPTPWAEQPDLCLDGTVIEGHPRPRRWDVRVVDPVRTGRPAQTDRSTSLAGRHLLETPEEDGPCVSRRGR